METSNNEQIKLIRARYWTVIALLLSAVIALAAWGIALHDENAKNQAIWEVICDTSSSPKSCRSGMDMMKGMSVDAIRQYTTNRKSL